MEESIRNTSSSEDEAFTKEWWIVQIEAWHESGLSVKDWCERENVCTYAQFIRSRLKYCPEYATPSREKEYTVEGWSALEIDTAAYFTIECRDVQLTIEKGFDHDLLREVLEVIRT
ncbi:IS66 family insertion sequence element accessory protein TnpA [Halalkalibacillus halophilus]|uniref:IS66 family insertion sequence element accessory protein TnpA n=1 Tax=Halalkalibacillus halophilus TaxID=392827 RepID=UPI0003FB3A32|nr:hypothetical protein [Halalkalibacillus halophilus]